MSILAPTNDKVSPIKSPAARVITTFPVPPAPIAAAVAVNVFPG